MHLLYFGLSGLDSKFLFMVTGAYYEVVFFFLCSRQMGLVVSDVLILFVPSRTIIRPRSQITNINIFGEDKSLNLLTGYGLFESRNSHRCTKRSIEQSECQHLDIVLGGMSHACNLVRCSGGL